MSGNQCQASCCDEANRIISTVEDNERRLVTHPVSCRLRVVRDGKAGYLFLYDHFAFAFVFFCTSVGLCFSLSDFRRLFLPFSDPCFPSCTSAGSYMFIICRILSFVSGFCRSQYRISNLIFKQLPVRPM